VKRKRKYAFLLAAAVLFGVLFQEYTVRFPPKATKDDILSLLGVFPTPESEDSIIKITPQTLNNTIEIIGEVRQKIRGYSVFVRDGAWNGFYYRTAVSTIDGLAQGFDVLLGPDDSVTMYRRHSCKIPEHMKTKRFCSSAGRKAAGRYVYQDSNLDGKIDLRRVAGRDEHDAVRFGEEWLEVVEGIAEDAMLVCKDNTIVEVTFIDGEWTICEDKASGNHME